MGYFPHYLTYQSQEGTTALPNTALPIKTTTTRAITTFNKFSWKRPVYKCVLNHSYEHITWLTNLSLVRVRLLSVNTTVGLYVLEGVVHPATAAAVVTVGRRAVHQVLFGQTDQLAVLQEVLTLKGTSLRNKT